MIRSTTISTRNVISSPTKSTNRDARPRLTSGARLWPDSRLEFVLSRQKYFLLTPTGATPYCFLMCLGSLCSPHRCTMERSDAEDIWICVVAGLRLDDHGRPGARAGDGCCASGQEHRRLLDPSFCSQDDPGETLTPGSRSRPLIS